MKNVGDIFLVIFNIRENPKKFVVHTFVSETFNKNKISQKFNYVFENYKIWLVVCTLKLYIEIKVNFR